MNVSQAYFIIINNYLTYIRELIVSVAVTSLYNSTLPSSLYAVITGILLLKNKYIPSVIEYAPIL